MIVERLEYAQDWVRKIGDKHVGRDEALQAYAMFDIANDRDRTEELQLAVKGIAGKYFCSTFNLTGQEIKSFDTNADVEDGVSYTFIMA